MTNFSKTKVWEEKITIPTYEVGKPDRNPMFLEKRVYQGSSGKVYPHSVIDKIFDDKIDKEYTAVYLENDFIKIMVLPEIGGRIQRATDKTNGYDFVYYNNVIKPALVGLAGPWISGGIEFNWPQHHRPSTFDCVDYTYSENEDGSATIVVSEIENMFRTKGMASFTVYPDSTYIEIKAQLFNRTDVTQTFLWWANPAVAVNDNTRSIFPPDVTAVMDHGKRAVSTFPIATGEYYKVDYSKGVDISRYKNLPVPTSYMAAKSDYDFVGGYDDSLQAGILHVADHHVSPGKKQWTWGCGDFGKAWDRNLTDNDGPYVELMTGCFTDNQPDFTWIAPMEEKRFTQYFMPYKKLGTVHNANKDLALNVELTENNFSINLFATGNIGEIKIKVYNQDSEIFTDEILLNVSEYKTINVKNNNYDLDNLKVVIYKNLKEILSYQNNSKKQEIPDAAKCPPLPKDCESIEDLFLYGLHIEQYRHATYDAQDYYLEGLKRDKTDIRLNNAYGLILFKQGRFKESQKYFETAVKKSIRSNPNPYDSEPYYNLGLSLFYQNKFDDAYDAFYKATWSNNMQENSYYYMASILAQKGDYNLALEHIENAIIKNGRNYKAYNLKTMLLKKLGKFSEAKCNAEYVLSLDCLDVISLKESGNSNYIKHIINSNVAIEIAIEYATAGCYDEAIEVLKVDKSNYPLVHYYMAYYLSKTGKDYKNELLIAQNADSYCCFPHRLQDIAVLEFAIDKNKNDFYAPYYLGNLLYDKKRYEQAIELFEKSISINTEFATPHRNLGLAYYNKLSDTDKALAELETAFSINKTDARVLMELDQLYKKIGKSHKFRLELLEDNIDVTITRDDLYLEYITLNNLIGNNEKAYEMIMSHKFHPWEGGEGKVPAQYKYSLISMARKAIECSNYDKAIELLNLTFIYPHNLGEGKLFGTQENQANYFLGVAYELKNDKEKAIEFYNKASTGLSEPQGAMYYNDQPPETIFYQGLALKKLGENNQSNERFNKLITYCENHFNDDVKIDYFAVSLPDFLVFDEDLNKKNKVHCLFMKALGYLGKGQITQSKEIFNEAVSIDKSHFGINSHLSLFNLKEN